tara:strand:- start:87 stop:389 length:303 start_codon:yes stop_codon:yes gene_type:complete
MKYWIVVKFTGFDGSQRQGDVTIWSDYTNSGHVYDSPAYEVIAICDTFKEALACKRHERLHKKARAKFVADKIVWRRRPWRYDEWKEWDKTCFYPAKVAD